MSDKVDDWPTQGALVMDKLATLEKGLSALAETVVQLRIEVAGIKVRAGIFAVIGSAIPVLIGLGIMVLSGR